MESKYTSVADQIEYGLDGVPVDRRVEVNLRDLVYAVQTLQELVRFFHQPDHTATIEQVDTFMGTFQAGALSHIAESNRKLFDMLPSDVLAAFEETKFDHPQPPYYYATDSNKAFKDTGGVVDQKIIPELYCSDYATSLAFYCETLRFHVDYSRPDERFAMLSFEGAQIMIEQTTDPGRRFVSAELTYPFGRGMNLQIEVSDVATLYARVNAAGCKIFLPLEDRWYLCDGKELGNRQFIVSDPDGYLLRFFQDIGERVEPA